MPELMDITNPHTHTHTWLNKYMVQHKEGLLLAKSKCVGGFPFKCFTKLYQSLVRSTLDYGACVCGHKQFPCIAAVQLRAIRSFLGLKNFKHCYNGRHGLYPTTCTTEFVYWQTVYKI